MENRNKKMTFRLAENEYKIIKEKIEKSEMTQQNFLLKTALEKEFINIRQFQVLIFQIKKIGVNVNQIVRLCNETGSVSESNVLGIRKELEKIWQLLKQLRTRTQA